VALAYLVAVVLEGAVVIPLINILREKAPAVPPASEPAPVGVRDSRVVMPSCR
jgi:hypothetical protein